MDLASLIALFPAVKEIIKTSPQVRKWFERKAQEEDITLLVQLQLIEEIRALRAATLSAPIVTAVLTSPGLSEEEVYARILKAKKIAADVAQLFREN